MLQPENDELVRRFLKTRQFSFLALDLDGTALMEDRGKIFISGTVEKGVKAMHDLGRTAMSCDACHLEGHMGGVMFEKTNPLLGAPNVVLTPHTGSRTYESVERQALMAAENMIRVLSGQAPHAQANKL